MTEKPKRFVFDLSDDDRDLLERHRASGGYRSHAETLRALIRDGEVRPAQRLSVADLEHLVAVTKPGVRVRVVDDGASAFVPLRMPRAPVGSLAKKPKGK